MRAVSPDQGRAHGSMFSHPGGPQDQGRAMPLLTHPHPLLPTGCRRTRSTRGPCPQVMSALVLRRDLTLTPSPEA